MAGTWIRTVQAGNGLPNGYLLLAQIAAGNTILRTRFSWSWIGFQNYPTDLSNMMFNIIAAGIVTTIGNGSEVPPNARTQSADQSPPAQRWLWWESRASDPMIISNADGLVLWRDRQPSEATDSRAQVSAPIMPPGDTLNVWWSYAFAYYPSDTLTLVTQVGASILYAPTV